MICIVCVRSTAKCQNLLGFQTQERPAEKAELRNDGENAENDTVAIGSLKPHIDMCFFLYMVFMFLNVFDMVFIWCLWHLFFLDY